jgi:ribosome biogenesis GTPase A
MHEFLFSRNPIIDDLIKGKDRVVVLNKSDLADKEATSRWLTYFRKKGYHALALNSMRGDGIANSLIYKKSGLRRMQFLCATSPFEL